MWVGALTPWNSPLLLTATKLAPALATGNTVLNTRRPRFWPWCLCWRKPDSRPACSTWSPGTAAVRVHRSWNTPVWARSASRAARPPVPPSDGPGLSAGVGPRPRAGP
ncbi:aldehyde dehydrogenase family protein [Nocardiopsis xinjiangensis]|uniref:aldehyde dehydrogenase family protein n=1 Tax=Nocardiopsis xinjiangensis TaxID=124285 RepID=UPI00373AF45C